MKTAHMDIMEFLHHYRLHPCLWDKTDPSYKVRQKKEEAEAALMEVTGIDDVKVLRAKIRSIRGTYNNEIRKINRSLTSASEELYIPRLHWFEYANTFLSKNAEDEPEYYDYLDVDCQILEDQNGKRPADDTDWEAVASLSLPTDVPSVVETISSTPSVNQVHKPARLKKSLQLPIVNPKRSRLGTEEPSTSIGGEELRKEHMTRVTTKEETPNEFAVFGQSVGIQLANIPIDTALKLQLEIQTLITNTRLKVLSECSS